MLFSKQTFLATIPLPIKLRQHRYKNESDIFGDSSIHQKADYSWRWNIQEDETIKIRKTELELLAGYLTDSPFIIFVFTLQPHYLHKGGNLPCFYLSKSPGIYKFFNALTFHLYNYSNSEQVLSTPTPRAVQHTNWISKGINHWWN